MDVREVKLPMGNHYFESVSADGFAFMGMAYHNSGLPTDHFCNEIEKRRYTLNGNHKILSTRLSPEVIYLYTHWVCYEFLRLTGRDTTHLVDNIKQIQRYPNGWHRYCDVEINYVVPNVTAMAALVYTENNDPTGEELINLLRQTQINGNWYYLRNGKQIKTEDNYHLGLMLYCFYRLGLTDNMVKKSLRAYVNTEKILNPGRVGWGIPVAYLIYTLYGSKIQKIIGKKEYDYRVKIYKENATMFAKEHINFRVRAISAWALTYKPCI